MSHQTFFLVLVKYRNLSTELATSNIFHIIFQVLVTYRIFTKNTPSNILHVLVTYTISTEVATSQSFFMSQLRIRYLQRIQHHQASHWSLHTQFHTCRRLDDVCRHAYYVLCFFVSLYEGFRVISASMDCL